MNKKKVGVLCILLFMCLTFANKGSEEIKIAAKRRDQQNPSIYGTIVVWDDYRNLRWDIFGYNLSTNEELHIARYAQCPAVYDNVVIWLHNDDNVGIWGYNLSTEKEFQLAVTPSRFKWDTAIYGDIVVWTHLNVDYDIYGYNLVTGQEFHIAARVGDQSHPVLYNNIVVWQDTRNGNSDIYGLNLSTQEEFQIASHSSEQISPAIYGDIIVWEDNRNGNYDIYGYDLSKNKEFQITGNSSDQKNPAVYSDLVVWEDNRNKNSDIYGYDLSSGQEFPLAVSGGDQVNPAVYGEVVIWEDRAGDDADICGVYISETLFDRDSDGHPYPADCDDHNADIHPGAEEICDRKDNDCDGAIDEGCTGVMEIIVIDSEGEKVEGAKIFIDGEYWGVTDTEGKFVTSNLITREYTIRVEAQGHFPTAKIAVIEKDETQEVVIELGKNDTQTSLFGLLVVLVFVLLLLIVLIILLRRSKSPLVEPSYTTCPVCNAKIQEDWIACPHCGADLTKRPRDKTRVY